MKQGGIIYHDPFGMVLTAYKSLCEKPVIIQFASGMWNFMRWGKWGETFFPNDEGPAVIHININLRVKHAVEILAHELAHVIVGYNAGHGADFENAFNEIHKRTMEIFSKINNNS